MLPMFEYCTHFGGAASSFYLTLPDQFQCKFIRLNADATVAPTTYSRKLTGKQCNCSSVFYRHNHKLSSEGRDSLIPVRRGLTITSIFGLQTIEVVCDPTLHLVSLDSSFNHVMLNELEIAVFPYNPKMAYGTNQVG